MTITQTTENTAPVLSGQGKHVYAFVHDWLTLPPEIGLLWGDTQGLAQDGQGDIYVAHTVRASCPCQDAVVVFDERGRFLRSFGAAFVGGAHGLDLRRENDGIEYLYLSDTRNRCVVKMTTGGGVVWETGLPDEARPLYKNMVGGETAFIPTNVAFAPDGGFYIGDGYGSDYVHRFDVAGQYVATFGGKGMFRNPHGLFVDERGPEPFLVVADRGNARLQYLTLDGKPVRFVIDGMRQPCHLDIRDGLVLVPDLRSVVTLLDEHNRVVTQLGDGGGHPSLLRNAPRTDYPSGKFIHPHDALFLRNGDILVSEWVPTGRITLLRRQAQR